MDEGSNERMLGLAKICQHISAMGLYGCVCDLPKASTLQGWTRFPRDRRFVGWFFVAGHHKLELWLTNCHAFAGLGRDSLHEHVKSKQATARPTLQRSHGHEFSWEFSKLVAALLQRLARKVGKRQKAISLIKRVGDHFSFAYSKWTSRFPDPQYSLSWTTPQTCTMSPLLDEGLLVDEKAVGDLSSSSHEVPLVPEPAIEHTSSGKGRTPLELPVRKGASGVELPVSSRTLAELGLSETAQRDFEAFRESILEQRPQVKNVQHITQTNGREYFLMTFDRVFSEFRYLKETQSITISCCGTGGRCIYVHDVAAHITHILYTASLGAREAGNFGAGILKRNEFHGNAAGLFYVRPPEHVALSTWDPSCDTFVP